MDVSSLPWLTVALAVPVLLRHAAQKFRQHLLKKETALMDWPLLGRPRAEKDKIPGTVVICGGSLAGLLAARVCHDHFERVVIVEAEAWLSTEDGIKVESWTQTNKRARVMQYTSLHGNLVPVTDGLLRLFPDFEAECKRSRIKLVPADFKAVLAGHKCLVPYDEFGGLLPRTIQAGRQATETLIRRLTLNSKEYPNISQISGTVTGTNVDPGNPNFLKTVCIQTATGPEEIDAALVIDCTGPAKAGQEWIRNAGFGGEPKALDKLTVTYDPRVRYSSFIFRITADLAARVPEYEKEHSTGALFMFKGDPNVSPTICAAMKIEEDFGKLFYTPFVTWGSEELPDNVEGIRKFLKSDKSSAPIPQWIWDFFDICEEVEDTMIFRKVRVPSPYWVHYESSNDLPANWIALGDSVSRINPAFGQGTTKAMMGAVSLNNVLEVGKSIPRDFSRRFFHAQADKIAPVWAADKLIGVYQSHTTFYFFIGLDHDIDVQIIRTKRQFPKKAKHLKMGLLFGGT
ncbi:hypothetical protein VKT23_011791 [Stygiomarasmius scandens]|uniref:FAD/NAD(P)-binding domain-containing protein n=1 Tax=Marasmiellus scandens TaxID=2682957 RepID=A0ABR1JD46_9AGAR